jgi:ubiquinol-cytochrome c reductase cytochrome c1 subunit
MYQVLPGAGVATANQVHSASEGTAAGGKSWLGWGVAGAAAAAVGAGTHIALAEDEAEHGLHAPQHPWSHEGPFSSYDHAAIRRGYQVYQQVRSHHTVLQMMFRVM